MSKTVSDQSTLVRTRQESAQAKTHAVASFFFSGALVRRFGFSFPGGFTRRCGPISGGWGSHPPSQRVKLIGLQARLPRAGDWRCRPRPTCQAGRGVPAGSHSPKKGRRPFCRTCRGGSGSAAIHKCESEFLGLCSADQLSFKAHRGMEWPQVVGTGTAPKVQNDGLSHQKILWLSPFQGIGNFSVLRGQFEEFSLMPRARWAASLPSQVPSTTLFLVCCGALNHVCV